MTIVKSFQKALETADENDLQSFLSACFEEYHHKVFLYARSRYKTYPEDVVQETFKKFQEAIRNGLEMDFRKDEDILRYLTTIAKRLSPKELGRAQRTVYIADFRGKEKPINPYTEINFRKDFEYQLKQLGPKQAEMLRLQVNGHSYEEIAQELDTTLMAVKQGLYRSRKKLKLLWNEKT